MVKLICNEMQCCNAQIVALKILFIVVLSPIELQALN